MNKILHSGLNIINQREYRRFIHGMKNSRDFQQKKLHEILKTLKELPDHHQMLETIENYEDFQRIPVASYKMFQDKVQRQKVLKSATFCKNMIRYQPTSGSSDVIKWIPYNKDLIHEFNLALAVWYADLAKHYPAILTGKHYWSLSWLPDDLRNQQNLDDSQVLTRTKKIFMQQIFAVPKEVMLTHRLEDCLFATVCFLVACEDLSLISVWSPTFLLSLLDTIKKEKQKITQVLTTGLWPKEHPIQLKAPRSSGQANILKEDFTWQQLWPKLALISCWDTGQSQLYAQKIKIIFPHVPLQGKGLWATEAVITIPFGDEKILAYRSHFYEFEELSSHEIYPSWELQKGMVVSPIVTTSNGFLRYRLNDRLRVSQMQGECPCLEFLGRIGDCDLVGEKLSHENVESLFASMPSQLRPLALIGIEAPLQQERPYYICLIHQDQAQLAEDIDKKLREIFHYNLARELHQLGTIRILASENAYQIYEQVCLNRGMIKGNIKIDPLIINKDDEFFYAHK